MIDSQRIDDARTLLARHFGPTRIARAASLSSPAHDVFLKLETDLPTGSFKVRGAVYALSVAVRNGRAVPDGLKAVPYKHNTHPPFGAHSPFVGDGLQAVPTIREVVCASTGNHGAAVAYAAQLLDVPATVFLPEHPNPVKAARIRALGARLVESGADLSAAIAGAQHHAERTGTFFLHDASDPDVPAGTATIGLEIVDQLPAVDVVYVPMGDTALIRGVASAVKQQRPAIRIVGVVAENAPAYLLSWTAARTGAGGLGLGAPASAPQALRRGNSFVVETATCETIADGLAVRRPLAPNVAAIRELVDEVVAVSEQEMIAAIEWLYRREQVIAEPAGAAATAAFLKERGGPARTSVLLVTGSNIAPDLRPAP